MPAPANAALCLYFKDLAHVRMELAALPEGEEGTDAAVKTLEMRVGAAEEQEMVVSWMKRVYEAAGGVWPIQGLVRGNVS